MSKTYSLLKCVQPSFLVELALKGTRDHCDCHCQSNQTTYISFFEDFSWLKDLASMNGPRIKQDEISSLAFHKDSCSNQRIVVPELYPI